MATQTVPGTAQISIVDGEVAGVTVSGGGFETSVLQGESPEQDLNTFFILISGFLVRTRQRLQL